MAKEENTSERRISESVRSWPPGCRRRERGVRGFADLADPKDESTIRGVARSDAWDEQGRLGRSPPALAR
jgi:hypothetical protein